MDTLEQVLGPELAELLGSHTTWALAIQVFLVVFAVVVTNFIVRLVLRRLVLRAQQTTTPWDEALADAAERPLKLVIWVVGIAFAAQIIYDETHTAIFKAVGPLRTVGVIGALTWFLLRFAKNVETALLRGREARGEPVDQTTVQAVGKLVRLSVLITAVLVGLQSLGFSVSGVLAFGGIGGIAVGFAAKDLLANFFGAMMIYFDRPFAVGDWIRSSDRNIEGTVEEIGWRLTRIRTFDKRPLYVPNSIFTQITVENPSRMTHRRIFETIGIRYDDVAKMDAITADVKAMLRAHPEIDEDQTLIVNFNQFGPSSLDFFVYTFTKTTQWIHYHEVKQDVLLKIAEIIDGHGAEIAFPTQTLHVADALRLAGMEERA